MNSTIIKFHPTYKVLLIILFYWYLSLLKKNSFKKKDSLLSGIARKEKNSSMNLET